MTARHARAIAQLELHRAAGACGPQRSATRAQHAERVRGLESRALTAIELAQPPQHGGRSTGFLAGLAQGTGKSLVCAGQRFSHELR